jgi:hypothetical protein
MSDFDWVNDIPTPEELGEEYRLLKLDAAKNMRYEEAAKYRDLEREVLSLPKFDEFGAWERWFNEAKESGDLHTMLVNLGRAV